VTKLHELPPDHCIRKAQQFRLNSDRRNVNTSFELDYTLLTALQQQANKLGFKSWGAYLRHVLDFHIVTFHPELLHEHITTNRNHKGVHPATARTQSNTADPRTQSKEDWPTKGAPYPVGYRPKNPQRDPLVVR
jgi:hypothetical protein